ncbi:MAG: UDP-N-acetylmuramoyl-L-alanyl-D-glutamate--2,6-diaminopimelate ligase [Pseudomonadota bacterium]
MTVTALKSPDAAARWLRSWVSGTVTTDSRKVRAGDAFIAWPGAATDGRRFVVNALQAGATTCLVEREGLEAFDFDDARIASLPGLKAATGPIADAFFEQPSRALEVLATTGTNGKTSTAWWTAQALTLLQRRCAVVGTLGIGVPPLPDRAAQIDFTGLTTPDPVMLHAALRLFADAGFKACAMEASSIGMVEQRLTALRIAVALFTNFTRDHLDYHGTMEAYWAAKRQLFAWPGLRAAVLNIDDPHGAALAGELQGSSLDVWTYSASAEARLRAQNLGYVAGGLAFDLHEGAEAWAVRSTLIGDYNASNLLAVIGGLRALGVSLADAVSVVPQLTPVPGRMQRVGTGAAAPEVVVDYAHTPDALEKVLQALRPLATARAGRLVCVFGCGGNRDATKRPLMGAIAARAADSVVVTSDNPRNETPATILAEIVAGIGRTDRLQVIEDRREAIAQALAAADARDVILIAGKGHEDYQEIGGVKHPFSDLAEAERALAARATR